MAKKTAKRNHEEKMKALTNALVSLFGMRIHGGKDHTAAKKHINNLLKRNGLTKGHILEAMPEAQEIIRNRFILYRGNHTVAKAVPDEI